MRLGRRVKWRAHLISNDNLDAGEKGPPKLALNVIIKPASGCRSHWRAQGVLLRLRLHQKAERHDEGLFNLAKEEERKEEW